MVKASRVEVLSSMNQNEHCYVTGLIVLHCVHLESGGYPPKKDYNLTM